MVLILILALLIPGYSFAADNILLNQGGTAPDVRMGGVGDRAKTSTTLDALISCERLQDSAANSHCVIVDAAKLTVISTTSAVTIGGGVAGDTYLKRIRVLAALTGTCVVAGFHDQAGVAQPFTLPATFVGPLDLGGAINSAGALTVTCSNASDDNLVLVEWWPAS